MIDVTYVHGLYVPDLRFSIMPSVTRVMTDILNNQKDLNVKYSRLNLLSTLSCSEYLNNTNTYNHEPFYKYFFKDISGEIETDYVLISLCSNIGVSLAIECLNLNKKVVLGGSLTKIYSLKELREIIQFNGGTNLHNLIIVRPFINRDVNLYNIIKEWKDIDLDIVFDVTNIFDTKDDCYLDEVKQIKKYNKKQPSDRTYNLEHNGLAHQFNTFCSWRKCTFCTYHLNGLKMKFLNENNAYNVAMKTINLMDRYDTDMLWIFDPEFYFTRDTKIFLEVMRSYNKQMSIFTSIKMLQNDTYFNQLFIEHSDVISSIMLGIECLDDTMLQLLHKDSSVKDIFTIITKIIKYNSFIDRPIRIINYLMSNLIAKNKQNIIDSYNNLFKLKELFDNSNTPYVYDCNRINVTPKVSEQYSNNPYIRLTSSPLQLVNTFERIDENNNVLPHDAEIIGEDTFNSIMNFHN